MNEIVKYHNKLNNFNYGRFSAVEADIFFSLVAKIRASNGVLIMSYDELKEVSNYYSRDEKRFVHDLESTFTKYLNLRYREDDGNTITITNVFQKLMIARDKKLVVVQVTPGMEDAILSISENFTRFELQEFTNLKSSYSKSLYRLLKQWRTAGKLYISVDEFRFKLDVPKAYRQTNIDTVVIKPAIEELSAYFKNLECRKEYKKSSSGRGRPAVTGFTFSFVPEERFSDNADPKEHQPLTQEKIAEKTGWTSTGKYCPRCKRPIFSSMQHNDNGSYTMYGHPDWKTGPCDYITYDIADLLEEYQLANEEPVTEEQKENKKRLKDMFAGLFG